jgi:general secretion pathway protein G
MSNNLRRSSGHPSAVLDEQAMSWEPRFQSAGAGFTFMELIASVTILLLLASIAVPTVQLQAKRSREIELRRALRELRTAIDHYKDFSDRGLIATQADTYGYPPNLEALVEGVPIRTNVSVKFKFLRRIPVDPMTGSTDWGLRSMQDDPDSRSWGGQNVFDVYTKSEKTALDGTPYADW